LLALSTVEAQQTSKDVINKADLRKRDTYRALQERQRKEGIHFR
jgi:hypothetical protein